MNRTWKYFKNETGVGGGGEKTKAELETKNKCID